MRLRSQPEAGSFYESFSDLIFGVLAIFVLLSMVFIVLVQSGGRGGQDTQKLQAELEAQKEATRLARAQAKAMLMESLEAARGQAKAESENVALNSKLQTNSLQLVIVVDRTVSMGDGLKALTETLGTFAEVMSQYAASFEVAVLAYHESQTLPYPMTQVLPAGKDGGKSLAALSTFLSSVIPINGMAPMAEAVAEATRVFSDPIRFSGAQVLMVVGDVGPFQFGRQSDGTAKFDPSPARESEVISVVQSWLGQSRTRRVVSAYTDNGCRKLERDKNLERDSVCIAPEESKAFFQKLCRLSGDERACQNVSEAEMLASLLKAITR